MTAARPETEQERRQAVARRAMAAVDAAGIGMLVTTFRTLDPRTLHANRAFCELSGYDLAELRARPTLDLVAAESLGGLLEIARQFVASGSGPTAVSAVMVRKDGRKVPCHAAYSTVELDGRTVGVTFVVDRSSRALAEEAIRRSDARFEHLLEAAPEALWIASRRGVRYANPATLRLFGVARLEDVLGTDPRRFVAPADEHRLDAELAKVLHRTVTEATLQVEGRAADGHTLDLEMTATRVEFDGAAALLCCARDVTAQRRLDRELAQSDRLAMLGLLAGGLAQAISNPLTYVLLNLDELDRSLPLLEAQPTRRVEAALRLQEALSGADQVAEVVRRMRALSRQGEGRPVPVDLVRAVASVLALVDGELRRRAHLEVACEPVPLVLAVPERLEQALLALLTHVAQRLPEGGGNRLEIRTGRRPGYGFVSLTWPSAGAAKSASESPDLRLAERAMREVGGALHLELAAEGGTVVTVLVPLEPNLPTATPLGEPPPPEPPPG